MHRAKGKKLSIIIGTIFTVMIFYGVWFFSEAMDYQGGISVVRLARDVITICAEFAFVGIIWWLLQYWMEKRLQAKSRANTTIIAAMVFSAIMLILNIYVLLTGNSYISFSIQVGNSYIYKGWFFDLLLVLVYPCFLTFLLKVVKRAKDSSEQMLAVTGIVMINLMIYLFLVGLGIWYTLIYAVTMGVVTVAAVFQTFSRDGRFPVKYRILLIVGVVVIGFSLVIGSIGASPANFQTMVSSWSNSQANGSGQQYLTLRELIHSAKPLGSFYAPFSLDQLMNFMSYNRNPIQNLLLYSGWIPTVLYCVVLVVFLLLVTGCFLMTGRRNKLRVVYLAAYLRVLLRSVIAALISFGMLPGQMNLPFADRTEMVVDSICIGILFVGCLVGSSSGKKKTAESAAFDEEAQNAMSAPDEKLGGSEETDGDAIDRVYEETLEESSEGTLDGALEESFEGTLDGALEESSEGTLKEVQEEALEEPLKERGEEASGMTVAFNEEGQDEMIASGEEQSGSEETDGDATDQVYEETSEETLEEALKEALKEASEEEETVESELEGASEGTLEEASEETLKEASENTWEGFSEEGLEETEKLVSSEAENPKEEVGESYEPEKEDAAGNEPIDGEWKQVAAEQEEK